MIHLRWSLLPLLVTLFMVPVITPVTAQSDAFDEARVAASLPVLTADWRPEWCGPKASGCTLHALKDFSGDGALDILTFDGDLLRIFTGPFSDETADASKPRASFQLQLGTTANIVTEDVNGDRSADISIVTVTTDSAGVYRVRIAIVYGMRTGRWPVRGATRNLGVGDRGDAVLTYILDARTRNASSVTPTFTLQYGDLNADKRPDLVLSIAEAATATGRTPIVAAHVKFGKSWGWESGFVQPDFVIEGFGACNTARSLVQAVADLDGDGVADLVTRSCARPGAPARLGFIPGRQTWPVMMRASEAVDGIQILPPGEPTAVPEPLPPSRPAPPPYYAGPSAVASVEAMAAPLIDLNGDGRLDFAVPSADGNMTSIFFGGPNIGTRLSSGRADRMIANGSLGDALSIGAWRLAGNGADGTHKVVMLGSMASTTTVNVYSGMAGQKRLLDGRRDRSPQRWSASGVTLLGVADLSGDGVEDLIWRYNEIWDGHFFVTKGPLGQ